MLCQKFSEMAKSHIGTQMPRTSKGTQLQPSDSTMCPTHLHDCIRNFILLFHARLSQKSVNGGMLQLTSDIKSGGQLNVKWLMPSCTLVKFGDPSSSSLRIISFAEIVAMTTMTNLLAERGNTLLANKLKLQFWEMMINNKMMNVDLLDETH